jgi:hypothetical protein
MFRDGLSIREIARRVNFSPYLLARLLVERICGISKKAVGAAIRNPERRIADVRLRGEVLECIEMDDLCSPYVDRIRRSVGEEREYVLQRKLANLGVPFETEEALRVKGCAKTPDAKLVVPIAVWPPLVADEATASVTSAPCEPDERRRHDNLPDAHARERRGREDECLNDGCDVGPTAPRVINWIESKAMFGDPYTHCTENLAQLRGYVNRYGPGMVIYWSGFVECPEAGLTTDPDILLAADVPARDRMDLSMLEGRPAACRTTDGLARAWRPIHANE